MEKEKNTEFFLIEFWSLLLHERVSLISKMLVLGFMGLYLLSPIDFVPDVLLPFGLIDDGGIILSLAYFFTQNARKQIANYENLSDEEKLAINLQGRSGCVQAAWGCITLIGGLAAIAVIGASIAIFVVGMTLSSLLGPMGNFVSWLTEPTTAQVDTNRTIVSSIKPLGQLVSVSVEVAQADILVSVDTGGLNLCRHSANHVAQGAVEAGVDITQIDENSVTYNKETNTYTITLPAPNITSCRIEYIRQYERSGGNPTCGIDWDNVRLLAQYEATVLFAADTLAGGILERAERESTLLMESLVQALTEGATVKVVYAAAEDAELPASCQPQLPRGWAFDEELNAWVESD